MDPEQKPQPREITIPINPRAMLKWLSFVVLLVSVFYVGKFSAVGFTNMPTANIVAVEEEDVLAKVVEAEPLVEEAIEEEPVVEANSEAIVEETVVEAISEPVVEEPIVEEPIVTKYSSKVTLGVEDLNAEWFGTWGKIWGFTLAIKNEEPGTIKPALAVMLLEGYNDIEKEVIIPAELFSIKSTETKSATVEIEGGFSYHPKTVGNLDKVKVQIILKDATGTVIRGFAEDMALPGE